MSPFELVLEDVTARNSELLHAFQAIAEAKLAPLRHLAQLKLEQMLATIGEGTH